MRDYNKEVSYLNKHYRDDPNYEIWFKDFHAHQEKYPYIFEGYDEAVIGFMHSDEWNPFLRVRVDKLIITEDNVVEVYSRDYPEPVVYIYEWDYWKIKVNDEN